MRGQNNRLYYNKHLVKHTTDGWSVVRKTHHVGQEVFLQLAVNSVEDVNWKVNCNNISYARKTVIRSYMYLAIDGTCSIHQIFPHL